MDDTTLIADSKENLKMIKVCNEFFKINYIKTNFKKYEGLRVNSDEKLYIEGTEIDKINNINGNRMLGIKFRFDNKRSVYIDHIKS